MHIVEWLNIYPVIETFSLIILISYVFLGKKNPRKDVKTSIPLWISVPLRHPWIIYTVVGLAGFLIGPILAIFSGLPEPGVHDEFSYLLAADTFAQGRLTNPPHPMWKHFETFHVIQQPTYASKYPPGQGLALAVGQVFFGHPIIGVWLSLGAACAAITWMLAGWVPLRWAWIGGLIAAIRLNFVGQLIPCKKLLFVGYWSQSYWGGSIATFGGALFFGALPRILNKQRSIDSAILALGIAILVNSRPFEGLVAIFFGIFVILLTNKKDNLLFFFKKYKNLFIFIFILIINIIFMCIYNKKITMSYITLPYQHYEAIYGVVPPFVWQGLNKEPEYRHDIIKKFNYLYLESYYKQRSIIKGYKTYIFKIMFYFVNYISIIFLPLLFFLAIYRRRWVNFNIVYPSSILIFTMVALLTTTWANLHYAAPVACLFFLIIVECLRKKRQIIWGQIEIGKRYIKGVIPLLIISSVASYVIENEGKNKTDRWNYQRADMLKKLEKDSDYHLIILKYENNHNVFFEWVYNKANIDAAKVVWARDMGPQENAKLIEYFKDRRIWLLEADKVPRKLIPYSEKIMEKSD